MISEARKNGIRLVLTLSNNYQDFGGRPQYVNWARSAGVSVNNDDDFYINAVIKDYYKNHVKVYICTNYRHKSLEHYFLVFLPTFCFTFVQRVITRVNTITGVAYKDDQTIMAWELMNEPRCQVDYSGKTLNVSLDAQSIDRL